MKVVGNGALDHTGDLLVLTGAVVVRGIKDVFQVFMCGINIDVHSIPERHIGPYAAMGRDHNRQECVINPRGETRSLMTDHPVPAASFQRGSNPPSRTVIWGNGHP